MRKVDHEGRRTLLTLLGLALAAVLLLGGSLLALLWAANLGWMAELAAGGFVTAAWLLLIATTVDEGELAAIRSRELRGSA